MANRPFVFPEKWGDDILSSFQADAFRNELATFVSEPDWQNQFCDVATVLHKCSSYALSAFPSLGNEALFLFMLAHSQYLASVRLVASGHCLAAYPTGRAAVEFAIYGWYLANDASALEYWHNKSSENDDKTTKLKWMHKFKFSFFVSKLRHTALPTAEWATYLHQTAIDFGAHPNDVGLYSNIEFERDANGIDILKMVFLHPWNEFSLSTSKFTVETGMFIIALFKLTFPDAVQELDLNQDINRISEKLNHLQIKPKT